MSPLKRVLLAIAALLIAMIAALLISWHLQERALSEALVSDVTATLARPIERSPRLESAKHENGFACLSAAMAAAPSDLRPFETKDQELFQQILDAGVAPDEVKANLAAIAPWASSLRSCGDSARLSYVPGLTPFEPYEDKKKDPMPLVMALSRMTRLEARLLAAEQGWPQIAERCVETLEVSLDLGHLNLLGAMVADSAVHQLVRPCAEALQHLAAEARAEVAPRYARLPARLASNAEFMALERQLLMLSSYRHLLSAEQQAKVPPGADWLRQYLDEQPLARFLLPRIWSRWDHAMRELVAAAGESPAHRQAASRALDGVFSAWWVPGPLSIQPNYEKFFVRNDDAALLLKLLAELAGGSEVTLSTQLVKTPEGLEFTKWDGEKLVIPLVR